MVRIFFERVRDWWSIMLAPPGYAKMVSTPACSRAWTSRSQPIVAGLSLDLALAFFVEVLVLDWLTEKRYYLVAWINSRLNIGFIFDWSDRSYYCE